jgi:hypothetical protein
MHTLPSHPRHPLVAGAIALLVALMFLAAATPDLGTVDFSIFGGGTETTTQVEHSLPTSPELGPPAKPTWVTDPLASPLDSLAGRN